MDFGAVSILDLHLSQYIYDAELDDGVTVNGHIETKTTVHFDMWIECVFGS